MLLRIWKVPLAKGQGPALERFADRHSTPMFRDLPGCLAALFARSDSHALTITLWQDHAALADAECSGRYRQVVARIEGSGILDSGGSTEVFTLYGGLINEGISELLS